MIAPFKWFTKSYIFNKFSTNPGHMLVVTGVLGWVLSCAAQIFAIGINDNLSRKEKMFLIPQELADGVVNCVSFYTVTNGMKALGKKLCTSAKLRPHAVNELLKERGLVLEKGAKRVKDKIYAGDWNFNITKLDDYDTAIKDAYKPFNNGVEVLSGLGGSILSSNLITPVFRNRYAANKQQQLIKYDKKDKNPVTKPDTPRITFTEYKNHAFSGTYSGGLKI